MAGYPEHLIRRETALEHKAKGAVFWDDTDLLLSPKDGALVVAPMKHGVHSCQGCGKPVDFENGVEVMMGEARLLMHSQCREPNRVYTVQDFMSKIEGQQFRRGLAKATRLSAGIEKAAQESKGKIIR